MTGRIMLFEEDRQVAPLDEAELEVIIARCRAASPPPWQHQTPDSPVVTWIDPDAQTPSIIAHTRSGVGVLYPAPEQAAANAAFIASAREDVERLVATVKALRRDRQFLDRVAERARAFVRRPEDLPGIELSEALFELDQRHAHP